jgi:hypothetical protein
LLLHVLSTHPAVESFTACRQRLIAAALTKRLTKRHPEPRSRTGIPVARACGWNACH